jgi:DNA-binding MarR family transcriptional regulator
MELEEEIDQKVFESEHQKAVINVLFTGKWIEYRHTCFFKQWELTPQQFNILRILRGAGTRPVTVQYLTERMLDKSSNASRLVDKLEEKGMAHRQTCPTNKRAVDVRITEQGLARLEALDGALRQVIDVGNTMTDEEAAVLNTLLNKMRASCESH